MTLDDRYIPRPTRVRAALMPSDFADPLERTIPSESMRERMENEVRSRLASTLGIADQDLLLTASGSDALRLALRSIFHKSGPGVIIVPSFVCPEVPLCIEAEGFELSFCDIDEDFRMNTADVERRLSNRTRAVLVVHMFGRITETRRLAQLCRAKNIHVIEDFAQVYLSRVPRPTSDSFAVFSFGRGKPTPAGGGGALMTPRALKGMVFDTDAAGQRNSGRARYRPVASAVIDRVSTRLSSGLLGRHDFKFVGDAMRHRFDNGLPEGYGINYHRLRRAIIDDVSSCLRAASYSRILYAAVTGSNDFDDNYSQAANFVVRCSPEKRFAVGSYFARSGIEAQWLYYPCHLTWPPPSECQPTPAASIEVASQTLLLPCHSKLNRQTVEYIAHAIASLPADTLSVWPS